MYIEVYVDGAARGQGSSNPVQAACGIVIYKNGKLIGQFARGLGSRTNNEAEYEAVLNGIMICWAAGLVDPIIYSDSTLVVNQVNKVWKCNPKNHNLVPYLLTIWDIMEVYHFRLQHVNRNKVKQADSLANDFLDILSSHLEDLQQG